MCKISLTYNRAVSELQLRIKLQFELLRSKLRKNIQLMYNIPKSKILTQHHGIGP